jgi:type VI secretion system protein ImpC
MARSLQVPFIASTAPEFFGVKSFTRLAALPPLQEKLKEPEYIKWNSFRMSEESLWTVLTVNRFLLRFPYGENTVPVKEFKFEEEKDESRKYLWANAVWIIGSVLASSFADEGWCTNICGQNTEKLLEPLPTREYKIDYTQKTTIPLEALIPKRREGEFEKIGLSLLTCNPDSNSAYMYSVPSAHYPKRYKDPEATIESIIHATLSYQLVAGYLSHYLLKIKNEIPAIAPKEEMEKILKNKIIAFIFSSGKTLSDESVIVQVTEDEEDPSSYNVAIRIQSVFKIMGKNIDLLLEWSS